MASRRGGVRPAPRRAAKAGDRLAEPQPVRRRRSDTLSRVLWAVPWIAIAIAIVVIGEVVFAAAMVFFACAAMNEYFRMARRARPLAPAAYALAAALIAAAHFGGHDDIVLVMLVGIPVLFFAGVSRPGRRNVSYSFAVTIFALAWIALPFAHAVLLRDLPLHGGALLIDVLVATFVADTAAYAGGRLFGSRPLAPSISPGKTIEGLAFGFVGGTMGFWFAGLYQDWLSGFDALLMGAVVAAVAPLGDLFESLVKRDLDVKDSGNLFGPHGGVLDRLDAVLFTVVAGYYLSVLLVY